MTIPIVRYLKYFVGISSVDPDVRFTVQTNQTQLSNTSVLLIAGGVYTSLIHDVRVYNNVVGTCFADQPGTLYIEYSSNGTNFDAQEKFPYTVGDLFGFKSEVIAPYVRLRFVNAAIAAQTQFRLYLLGKH